MRIQRDPELAREAIVRGVRGGVIGALAMAGVMMLVSASRGDGFWTPLALMGAALLGPDHRSAGGVALGAVIHLAVGASFGVLYALLARRVRGIVENAMLGIVFGAVVFAPMTYLLLPVVDPIMYRSIHLGVLFVAHLVYGLVLGIAVGARAPRREPSVGHAVADG
jgi:hypothetical protein